jgi:hypothetical protein
MPKAIFVPRGTRFGDWIVLAEGPRKGTRRHPRRTLRCQCECGRVRLVCLENLRGGRSQRCQSCSKTIIARLLVEDAESPAVDTHGLPA